MRTSAVIAAMSLGAVLFTEGWLRAILCLVCLAAIGRACEPKRH